MCKSLYNKTTFKLTQEGTTLLLASQRSMKNLFRDFIAKGFSPREVASVMQEGIRECELDDVMNRPDA